jgi:hypothetical protein
VQVYGAYSNVLYTGAVHYVCLPRKQQMLSGVLCILRCLLAAPAHSPKRPMISHKLQRCFWALWSF